MTVAQGMRQWIFEPERCPYASKEREAIPAIRSGGEVGQSGEENGSVTRDGPPISGGYAIPNKE